MKVQDFNVNFVDFCHERLRERLRVGASAGMGKLRSGISANHASMSLPCKRPEVERAPAAPKVQCSMVNGQWSMVNGLESVESV